MEPEELTLDQILGAMGQDLFLTILKVQELESRLATLESDHTVPVDATAV